MLPAFAGAGQVFFISRERGLAVRLSDGWSSPDCQHGAVGGSVVTQTKAIKRVVLVAPKSTGGNFEYVAIFRQGLLYLSAALGQWQGDYLYEREVWLEDRVGQIDLEKDLEGTDILLVTALINEAPRAYEIARLARLYHPQLRIVGGGPHMGPLAEETLRTTGMDAVVMREGEDVIGPLCDLLLRYQGADRTQALHKFSGIAFLDDGHYVENARHNVIAPNYVELPDYSSVKDLTPANPLAAGIIETVRGCTEKCTYCQVIQQFLGYRMVPRETELRRLAQLRRLAEDGLIYTAKDGRFSVFVSDDLHPPPLRAVKYRDERLARLRDWKSHTEGMWLIGQSRAEIGQDPEIAQAMREAGFAMLYVGVESSNAKNLELVRKRQDPTQVHRDLTRLNELGFIVAAMTMIGLPYDTEESIMEMAQWVRTVSRYQTANWLTPLPATHNWHDLTPLDEDGSLLPAGKMRPYHLYTGKQLVHQDERWTLQQSREMYAQYTGRLRPVDALYERIFRMFRSRAYYETLERRQQYNEALTRSRQDVAGAYTLAHQTSPASSPLGNSFAAALTRLYDTVSLRLDQLEKSLAASLADLTIQASAPGTGDHLAARLGQLQHSTMAELKRLRERTAGSVAEAWKPSGAPEAAQGLAPARLEHLGQSLSLGLGEFRDRVSRHIGEWRENVTTSRAELQEALTARTAEMQDSLATRIRDLGQAVTQHLTELRATQV
ncbi:MAG: radical SAM protein [Dehalococcoidia bacterium]|nr:radical SAM protein [Dehalococcoidia bacterium]